ncbi:MAG: hypothetical protein ACAI38_19340 [Myxococcota bacterium]
MISLHQGYPKLDLGDGDTELPPSQEVYLVDIRRFGFKNPFSSTPSDPSAPAKKPFTELSRSEQMDILRPIVVKTLGFGIPVASAAAALYLGLNPLEAFGIFAGGAVAGAAAAGFTHMVMGGEISVIR